ncbi:MAG: EamA family transporter [Oceanicoccus sp.]
MTALSYALASMTLSGVFEIIYRLAHKKGMHEGTYMVTQTGTVFLCLAIYSSNIGFEISPALIILAILSGIVGMMTGWSHIYAIGRGPVAVTSSMRKLGFIVTALLALVFLDESLNTQRIAGLAIATAALLIIGWAPGTHNRPHPAIFISLVGVGVMTFFHKIAATAGISITVFLMIQSGTAHIASHFVCLKNGGYKPNKRLIGFAMLSGCMISLSMTFGMYALRHGDAIVIAPILQLGFLIAAPVSFLLFKEPITKHKLAGLSIGTLAIVLFASGG